jgi:triosephosphate isomerase
MTQTNRRPLIAGNWKMNGVKASAQVLGEVMTGYAAIADATDCLVCPPATLLLAFSEAARGSGIAIGAQDCHAEASGAFTGDISAPMLADAGAVAVIVGHSERRTLHGETDTVVLAKARAALAAGLAPIVCVGETREERESGRALEIVGRQIEGSVPQEAGGSLVVAYEPVWAIGTGLTPSNADIAEMHAFMRDALRRRLGDVADSIRLLYGGSVKPANAAEILALDHVDGALVGGASLVAEQFLAIARAYART